MSEKKQSKRLDYLLAENNLENVVLPQFLFTQCEISNFEKTDENFINQICFEFSDKENNISGNVRLDSLENGMDFLNGKMLVKGHYEEAKQLTVNGIDIVVFVEKGSSFIIYYLNDVEYNIVLNGVAFEKAVEIASAL